MRMRKKPNLGARMERCAQFLIEDPKQLRGQWRSLKPEAGQLWLELGCGKGRFTAETAEQNPDVLYIAVERVPDAMIVAMERCAAKGLSNVFFVDGDAALLREFFAPPRPAASDPPEFPGALPGNPERRGTDPF